MPWPPHTLQMCLRNAQGQAKKGLGQRSRIRRGSSSNNRMWVARWSLWLVEKLTFKHETPAKVDAMTMARALLGMSCLLSWQWQSLPRLQSQLSQHCWANFMCVLLKKKLKIYIPMYDDDDFDWFPYDCLSNCPTVPRASPLHLSIAHTRRGPSV